MVRKPRTPKVKRPQKRLRGLEAPDVGSSQQKATRTLTGDVSVSPAPEIQADEHVFLIGRPPMGEYLGFIQAQTVNGDKADLGALSDDWRAANDHIRDLEVQEVGWADNPVIVEIQKQLEALRESAAADPIYRRSYSIVPSSVKIIELDRLVVFQKHINLEYVRLIHERLGKSPSDEDIFRFCLPFGQPRPGVQLRRVAQNSFIFVSPSNDLRFLDCTVLQPGQVSGYQPTGPMAGLVALAVGYGANCLSALHVENRLILQNGSHRAFALRDMGITHVPCVIQHVSRRDELPVIANPEVVNNADLYLKAPRPPLLKDYFDPKLRKLVAVPKQNRPVKISFGVETIDV
jgi:hypothetical protein